MTECGKECEIHPFCKNPCKEDAGHSYLICCFCRIETERSKELRKNYPEINGV
jgi:hypothetical protein